LARIRPTLAVKEADDIDRKQKIWELRTKKKYTYQQIADELGISHNQVRWALEAAKKKHTAAEVAQLDMNTGIYNCLHKSKGPRTKEEIKQLFGITDRVLEAALNDLKDAGTQIEEADGHVGLCKTVLPPAPIEHEAPWKGDQTIRFGLCGDKHFNSKYTQITHMHELYDIYQREGITTVYDPGDLDEGEKMRKGHQYECYNQGADDHVKEIVKNHPRRPGMKTYFTTGNHDLSLVKLSGMDIGQAIAEKRDDMVYLGQSWATVKLTPNCILELRHPEDATAYAISYKTQQMINAMHGGEKPNIMAIGHYHKAEYLFYRNVHAFQVGTLQGQSNWMRNKGIAAMVGGWIVEVDVNGDGTITRVKSEFFPFYQTIPNDYENWQ
jgi:transcriptional regulator with XRE-family HTH domain/UDP-2,3-diacylglucosamine pyrophosphatase LpxH